MVLLAQGDGIRQVNKFVEAKQVPEIPALRTDRADVCFGVKSGLLQVSLDIGDLALKLSQFAR